MASKGVGTNGVRSTVQDTGVEGWIGAFIHVGADDTITLVPNVAFTGETAGSVGTGGIIGTSARIEAFVVVGTGSTIAGVPHSHV